MRSLLRDFFRHARSARNDILFAWLALLLVAIGGCAIARGEEMPEASARAALALAKAKRERETMSCFSDYETAAAESQRRGKPLVLWVGVKCVDHPRLRRDLADAVHCHLTVQRGDRTPRVVIQGADGIEWFVRPEKIGRETARRIREKWEAPRTPLLRNDVGIMEEIDSGEPDRLTLQRRP
jgi:hypothetical protein